MNLELDTAIDIQAPNMEMPSLPIEKALQEDTSGQFLKKLIADFEFHQSQFQSQIRKGASSEEFDKLNKMVHAIEASISTLKQLSKIYHPYS